MKETRGSDRSVRRERFERLQTGKKEEMEKEESEEGTTEKKS